MAVAVMVSVVSLAALRPAASAMGLIDKPGGRKLHDGDVPVIGGIAMFAGIFAGLLLLKSPLYELVPLLAASSFVLFIGVLDDRFHLSAAIRLSAQIAAVLLLVYGADLSLTSIGAPFGTGEVSMGRFAFLFTTLVTLTMVNAYNLIDGVDGLAGSLALVAMISIAAVGGAGHAGSAAALTVSAAIVGFLVFNFPTPWNSKLRTFMGDAGSTLLGFTIVWVTLGVSQGSERTISPVICLWFASIPVYDLLTCFIRRSLAGTSPFTPGRDHFHHELLRGGFGVRETLAILTGLQAIYAILGLLAHFNGVPDVVMFSAWSVLGLLQYRIIGFISRHQTARLARKQSNATN